MFRRWLFLVLVLALLATTAHSGDFAADEIAVRVDLLGGRAVEYDFAPVFRRGEELQIYLTATPVVADDQLRVEVVRLDAAGRVAQRDPFGTLELEPAAPRTLTGSLTLTGAAGEPAPVGPYRAKVWLQGDTAAQLVAVADFFLIFNALNPADAEVYRPDAARWLSNKVYVVHDTDERPRAYSWNLAAHEPEIFELAIAAASGAQEAAAAVARVAAAAAAEVEGYWPDLASVTGSVPPQTPAADPEWDAAGPRSVLARLQTKDRRGQCFDFSAVTVALLRSIGVPATAVTALQPAAMPHPYHTTAMTRWRFHVWTETWLNSDWWAVDTSYLNRPTAATGRQPGLQPRLGPWFRPIIGPLTRIVRSDNGRLVDLTARYRRPAPPAPRPLGLEFGVN